MKYYFIHAELRTSHNQQHETKVINGIFEIESPDKIINYVETYFGIKGLFSSVQWNIFYHNIQLLSWK